jgi:predicted NBD/HSP70 family sugar kinase
MLYFSVEDGIGAAVMFNGKVQRGNHGMVGEIGHTTVRENGKLCACGNYGCLETISSDIAIIDQACSILNVKKEKINIDKLVEISNDGDKRIEKDFIEAAKCLAITLRNTFAMYDPDEIAINCRWLLGKKDLYFKMIDSLYDNNNLIDRRNTTIRMIDIDNFGLRSAAAIVATHEMESMESTIFSDRRSLTLA